MAKITRSERVSTAMQTKCVCNMSCYIDHCQIANYDRRGLYEKGDRATIANQKTLCIMT